MNNFLNTVREDLPKLEGPGEAHSIVTYQMRQVYPGIEEAAKQQGWLYAISFRTMLPKIEIRTVAGQHERSEHSYQATFVELEPSRKWVPVRTHDLGGESPGSSPPLSSGDLIKWLSDVALNDQFLEGEGTDPEGNALPPMKVMHLHLWMYNSHQDENKNIGWKEFGPRSAGESFRSYLGWLVSLYVLVCLCALCCCRGIFHYLFCKCFCGRKETPKAAPEVDPRDAMTYPSSISVRARGAGRQTVIPTPRRSTSALSLKLAAQSAAPALVDDPSTTADPDSPTLKSIKIEGGCSPSVAPCLKGLSGLIDVPEPDLSSTDSASSHRTPADQEDYSDVDVAMPTSEASISAAVRAASSRTQFLAASAEPVDTDTSSTEEVDVAMPVTDASISAAVRVAHQD